MGKENNMNTKFGADAVIVSWLDVPDHIPLLKDRTINEKEEVVRWLMWEIFQDDPRRENNILQKLFRDSAVRADHATWRTSA